MTNNHIDRKSEKRITLCKEKMNTYITDKRDCVLLYLGECKLHCKVFDCKLLFHVSCNAIMQLKKKQGKKATANYNDMEVNI